MIERNADRWRVDNGVWCAIQKKGRTWIWRVDNQLDGGDPLYHGEAATPDEARRKANEAASWWMLAQPQSPACP